ncbi:GGDEF domain-containing protein [Kineosporia sp. NBRC 101677]|uniref:GGDEF domain-containing protein n=1 Tax=Kineosporia sp. NBRC 101677 TaxID=3032197 RepID=UPI002553F65E|nr:GGDEF domain-containing protein [Kineosporia sp. NBRC 101677]
MVVVVVAAGTYVHNTTSASGDKALAEFDARVAVAAKFVSGTLAGNDAQIRADAERYFAGTQAQMRVNTRNLDLGTAWYAVLDADGRMLFAHPRSDVPAEAVLSSDPGFAISQETGKIAFGNIDRSSDSSGVLAYQPFDALDGPRLMVVPVPLAQLDQLFAGAISPVTGSSYVIDGEKQIITSSTTAEPGTPLGDQTRTVPSGSMSKGVVGNTYFSAHQIADSRWQLLMTAPRTTLLAPVQAASRAAWQLFAAFAAAMLLILLMGFSALGNANRLAKARLHDPLTGLPNRALFMERTDAAINDWRRRRSTDPPSIVGTLFLDLDGFKPVNDTYGHATGDDLLRQVARRLADATRPDDFVCRFGGDEFLVLCRGVRHSTDVHAVAERIRSALSEPFDLDGHPVTIGVSIGIAVLTEDSPEAATLIHNADMALYRAKENGRGRIEVFASA